MMNKAIFNRVWSLSLVLVLSLGMTLALLLVLDAANIPSVRANHPARPAFAPVPTGTAPVLNSRNIPFDANVSITFDEAISVTSVTSRTFAVYGSQSALFTGTYFLSNLSRTVTFDPARAYFPGERMDASVTTGTLNLIDENAISATVWQFWAGVGGGSAHFIDAWQAPSSLNSYDVSLGDLNGDGYLDAFVVIDSAYDRILMNDGSGNFSETQSLTTTHTSGTAVDLGDVDGDGDLDAFVTTSLNDKVVWTNDGSGTFSESELLNYVWAEDVALGDLDGDGDLDAFIASGNVSANQILWNSGGLQGGATGIFTDSGQTMGAFTTRGVALGDVDGDGDLDVFVANDGDANQVWLNTGGIQGGTPGIFTDSLQTLAPVSDSAGVALGDLDSDGDLDAFVVNFTNQGNTVWINNGGVQGGTPGVFSNSMQSLGFANSYAVTLGDVDADGDLDALVANQGASNRANIVYLNNGAGGFVAASGLGDSNSYGVALGDVDGDGDLDAFVANSGTQDQVWLNQTAVIETAPSDNASLDSSVSVTFSAALSDTSITTQIFAVHSGFWGYMTGTLNVNDDNVDFVPIRDFYPGELVETSVTTGVLDGTGLSVAPHVWRFRALVEHGGGRFVDSGQSLGGGSDSYDVALGDVDGDGDLDAVANDFVFYNDSNTAKFTLSQTLVVSYGHGVALGDLDNDGDLDAYVARGNGTNTVPDQVWFNDGGTFSNTGQSLSGHASYDVALGDLDGDGDLDAFTANINEGDAPSSVWFNDGGLQGGTRGTFSTSSDVGSSLSRGVALGDLDGDGDLDVFLANDSTRSNKVWLNDGTGDFVDSGQMLGAQDSQDVALGDVDGDGDLDAVVVNAGGSSWNVLWLNDGTGVFTDSGQMLAVMEDEGYGVALGDVDGDGDLDIFFVHDTFSNQVWHNDGKGKFTQAQTINDGAWSNGVALGDLNGDGALDAFIANISGQASEVWLNRSNVLAVDPAPNSHAAALDTSLTVTASKQVSQSTVTTQTFVTHGGFQGRISGTIDFGSIIFDSDQNFFPGELVETSVTSDVLDYEGLPLAPYVWQFRAGVGGGVGTFVDSGQLLGLAGSSREVALGDLDADGDLDAFVLNNWDANRVWINQGGDQLGTHGVFADSDQSIGDTNHQNVALGDVDGDGDLDAFVVRNGSNHLWENTGGGMFPVSQTLGSANSSGVALGDVDGDGDLDAFVANDGSDNKLWVNDGDGTFTDMMQFLGSGKSTNVALGDLDNDGDLDAFVTNYGSTPANTVWLNVAQGIFSDTGQSLGAVDSFDVELGDLDDDGDLDAFVANYMQPDGVWFNDGTGFFTATGQVFTTTDN
ncbi:MAG: hypothetical protein GY832_25230, partial [Chloroflexi bacterium]|nr:hypothetical protein [Chloroflexota bacterium]